MGGDARQGFTAHVAEGGAGMGTGVPVVHAREVLHVELRGLLEGTALSHQSPGTPSWYSLPLSPPESAQTHSRFPSSLQGCAKGSSSCPAAKGTPGS